MSEISNLLDWAWISCFGVIAYFLRDFHHKVQHQDVVVRRLQLEVQKQGTENEALFKRMDEVKEALRDLNTKLDSLILAQQRK